ncbi:MAG: response regulator [Desulfuromonadaceae bacterium]|nr:response regulator [Desulfuromonadaceae bacterium]MDD5104134.1 response regulator [Desulfuromonadaceae bacterium]
MNFTPTIPILLVDDRQENLLSLEELLGDQGYQLVRALSGNEALRLTLKQEFALVLLDVQMPDMDGYETAELMRANPKTRNYPIIFVTAGLKDSRFQFKGYDAGAVDYLTKPIEPLILQSKVKVFAELYRQQLELEQHKKRLEELVRQRTAELTVSNEQLVGRNVELRAVEELLRGQIADFRATHGQLLATEEMLRIQIEEYQTGQQLLKEANRNLKTLFDVSPLAIIVSTFPDGVIREINRTFSDDFGYTAEQAIGTSDIELGVWLDSTERERFLRLMGAQQGVESFETAVSTCQGGTRQVLLYSNLMDFNNEKCLLIVFLDVTEQKRLEAQIRQTQKLEVIGQLAGGVAHDFNNMLTAISGSAELMVRHVKDDQHAMKLLGSIQQAASRSADLTRQLLAFSRKEHKNSVPICIGTTITDVMALLERTIDKRITLETHLCASNDLIAGDPALLQNALLNLGVNARDAMPEGGVLSFATANVELGEDQCSATGFSISPGSYIEISVSDTGVGMTQDVLQHIFEPFFTTKEAGKGTGLGLAAVFSTVTDHHGSITICSEPGSGTIFKLYLPLSDEVAVENAHIGAVTHGSGGILLVDDEEILRDVGQTMLEDLGYRVYLAEDGVQALEVYAREKNNIALVILDMQMPRMGGREVLSRLTESDPGVKILISSGFHQEGTPDDLKKHGACGFLQKPYTLPELCRELAAVFASGDAEYNFGVHDR